MCRARRDRRQGLAAVELALVLPLLMTLLVGAWDIGRAVQVKEVLMGAAREGARQASTGRLTNSQVEDVVVRYIQNAGLPPSNLAVSVRDLTNPSTDVSAAEQLDQLSVTVSIPFRDARLVTVSLVNGPNSLITAESTWYSLKDKPYPDPADPPIE